jgi:hypothetical protein
MNQKTQTLQQVEDELEKAKNRVAHVAQRDKDLLRRQLVVERTVRRPQPPEDESGLLDAILNGASPDSISEKKDPLATLKEQRERLKKAEHRGQRIVEDLTLQRATLIYAQCLPEVVNLEKRRLLLAIELQAVNAAREDLRDRLREKGAGGMFLPLDRFSLLGLSHVADEVAEAKTQALSDRIVTKSDIAKAAGNG